MIYYIIQYFFFGQKQFLDNFSEEDLDSKLSYKNLLSCINSVEVFAIAELLSKKNNVTMYETLRNVELAMNKIYHTSLENGKFKQLNYCRLKKQRRALYGIRSIKGFSKIAFNKRLFLDNISLN